MERLTVRDLSRETATVLDRVERGETIEVTRGNRVVAKIAPIQGEAGREALWKEHVAWLSHVRRPSRAKIDPVDELRSERGHRHRHR